MAKKSSIEKNERRKKLTARYAAKRKTLKAVVVSPKSSDEEKRAAVFALAKLPRNSNPTRVARRCELTGRRRGYYRKFKISRIMLRELAHAGLIPGMRKSSW